jgi:uncharacterized membrane protein YvbJ
MGMIKCEVCGAEIFDESEVCNHCGWKVNRLDIKSDIKPATKKILLTTTNKIDGWDIVEYIYVITKQVVVGAGIFTEFFSGFTDAFVGRSEKVEGRRCFKK